MRRSPGESLATPWRFSMKRCLSLSGWGTTGHLRERIAMNAHPADQIINRRHLDRARSRLGSERFAAAWDKGRDMELDAAIGMALTASSVPSPESQTL